MHYISEMAEVWLERWTYSLPHTCTCILFSLENYEL